VEAWLQLMKENPPYASRISPTRLQEMRDVTVNLKTAIERIPNAAVFGGLLGKYDAAVATVQQKIQAIEEEYKKDPNHPLTAVDLWGGANQTINYTPSVSRIDGCNGRSLGLSLPNNWAQLFSSPSFLLADYLGIGKVGLCAEASWINKQTDDSGLVGVGTFEIRLYVTYREASSLLWMFHSQRMQFWVGDNPYATADTPPPPAWVLAIPCLTVYPYDQSPEDPYQCLGGTWENGQYVDERGMPVSVSWKSQFETSSQTVAGLQQILSQAKEQVEQELRKHEISVCSKIVNTLSSATVLHDAARILSGGKLAIESFVALGLQHSLEQNDFLRALLYGKERLLDEDVIRGLYSEAIAALQAGQVVPKVDVSVMAKERSDALEGVLVNTFNRIEQGQFTEGSRLVETTLRKIDLYTPPSVNLPPTVNAGPDQTVTPGTLVILQGQGQDPEGGNLTFNWIQTAGPTVTLNGATTAQPTFTAPNVTTDTILTFQIKASDSSAESAPDMVNITVRGGSSSQPTFTATLVAIPQTVSLSQKGQKLSVTLTVKNTGAQPVSLTVSPLTVKGTGGVEFGSEPGQYATTIKPSKTKTFEWRYTATGVGTIQFSGKVTNAQGASALITSNPVTITE